MRLGINCTDNYEHYNTGYVIIYGMVFFYKTKH